MNMGAGQTTWPPTTALGLETKGDPRVLHTADG
jgi:hypothetical protein